MGRQTRRRRETNTKMEDRHIDTKMKREIHKDGYRGGEKETKKKKERDGETARQKHG